MIPSAYLTIAREAIEHTLVHTSIDREKYLMLYPQLRENGATFVTLKLHNSLRGCIGSLIAHRPLIDDLIANAISSAFKDPRFKPVTIEELTSITIEVSILSDPKLITYSDTDNLAQLIRPKIDGVILRHGNHQATFLPQVWDELTDFNSFFSHLGNKAGIGSNPLIYHPEIYTYQVDKIKES